MYERVELRGRVRVRGVIKESCDGGSSEGEGCGKSRREVRENMMV